MLCWWQRCCAAWQAWACPAGHRRQRSGHQTHSPGIRAGTHPAPSPTPPLPPQEKEDWINAVGRAIVKHSRSLLDNDQADYTNQ